jgi:HlyD family secretion protein
MTSGRVITTIIFILLGVFGGFQLGKSFNSTDPQSPTSTQNEVNITTVLAEGKIAPFEGIRMVMTAPGRKVSLLNVDIGAPIAAEKTELCVMTDEPLLKMQWELAVSRKQDVLSEIEQKLLNARLNRNTAETALQQAELSRRRLSTNTPELSYVDKKIELSKKKLEKIKRLSDSSTTAAFVSTQDILDQELELEKVKSEKKGLKEAADLAVNAAQKGLKLADELIASAEKAKSNMQSLVLAEKIAKQQYENARVLAPIDGEVVKIHTHAGDAVTNMPLMEVANLSKMCVEAEVYFANLTDVKEGQRVIISSPALSEDIDGVVVSKSNYIGDGLLQSPNPLAMTDQETAKVKIEIDTAFNNVAKRFLNLQVTVKIQID